MTQVINHSLGYKIVHNPGYDFDLDYKNKSEFFYYRIFDIKTRAIIRPVSLILPEFSATKNEKKCPNVVK